MTHCETCKGTGYVIIGHKRVWCSDCDGRGETHLIPKGSYSGVLKFERKKVSI